MSTPLSQSMNNNLLSQKKKIQQRQQQVRPGLSALNRLNMKLQSDYKYVLLQNRIKQLQLQRQNLYEYVQQLKDQLQLQKKLRSSWQKNNNTAQFINHHQIKSLLNIIKSKQY